MLHTTPPIHIHQFHLYPDHGSEHSLTLDQTSQAHTVLLALAQLGV